jgi:predicted O-methyltransferase YrrM
MLAKIPETLYRKAHGNLLTRRELAALGEERDRVSTAVARAISATLNEDASTEERRWAERIEELREALATSTDELTLIDFGAVSPELNPSQAEMEQGVDVQRTVGEICRSASKPPRWAFLLFKLVRELQPASCVELGTSLGISTAYQAAALELNGQGRLVSLEGAEPVAALAKKHLEGLGLNRAEIVVGRFQDTLGGVLQERNPVDYAFVDGHHDRDATLDYFERLVPALGEEAVLVFDDIAWSSGMKDAWAQIRDDPRVSLAVDLFKVGVCAVGPARNEGRTFRVALD